MQYKMAGKIEMNKKDMAELYQLLKIYRMVYPEQGEAADQIAGDLEARYREAGGAEISRVRNPRNAGRKRTYTEEREERIIGLRREKHSMQEIAKMECCSLGMVQRVLKEGGVS